MTLQANIEIKSITNDLDALIDGYATASIIGLRRYIKICDTIGTRPIVLDFRKNVPEYYGFSTKGNISKPDK